MAWCLLLATLLVMSKKRKRVRICKGCSEPIEGEHLKALKAYWHPEHFCCVVCQKLVTEERFYVHEGGPCHPACYEKNFAHHCALCAEALMGEHQINYWGDRYCLSHNKELASCHYCGRLARHISKKMERRGVDDVRCEVCAATAVEDHGQAMALLPQLIRWVEAQGLRFRQKTFRVEVLDRVEFTAREGGAS